MNSRDPGLALAPAPSFDATAINPLDHGMALFEATPPDYARAVGWFRASADAGDADGLAMLGLCQLEGLGLTADAVLARTQLETAASRGSAIGRFHYGRVLMTGSGGPADEERGLAAYVAAAAAGHPEACFNLANCLYAGVGCLPDRLAAKALYLRSRTLGCTLRAQGVRIRTRELKVVSTLAQRFADPDRLIFLVQERQQELALAQAVAQREQRREARAKPRGWRKAGRMAAGVVAAMAGTLAHYVRIPRRDAGPTTVNY